MFIECPGRCVSGGLYQGIREDQTNQSVCHNVTSFICYHHTHIPSLVPFLDCEVVNQGDSHVRMGLQAECQDGDTNEEYGDDADSLQFYTF